MCMCSFDGNKIIFDRNTAFYIYWRHFDIVSKNNVGLHRTSPGSYSLLRGM